MNEILLRRKNKIIVHCTVEDRQDGESRADAYIATIMKNVEALGYTFSWEVFEVLRTMELHELQELYLELIPILKKMAGADVVYQPMYPNFPDSVMAADETRLYINAIVHYWSFGTLVPSEQKNERLPLFEAARLKVIGLGSMDDFQDIFMNLCQSKTSLSQTDKEDLVWIFRHLQVKFPEEIPLKENAALIGNLYLENDPQASAEVLEKFFKTATDVLRLITIMSNGDVSLGENTRYRNFHRRERRLLLELLQNCGSIEEDMLRYGDRWIRVGEKLHPGEYSRLRFGKVITAFDKLRNHVKIETFAGKVEHAIVTEDYGAALELLKKRPGELARRLDHLLRKAEDKKAVINAFKAVADEVSTPVLLQVREHFLHRNHKETAGDGKNTGNAGDGKNAGYAGGGKNTGNAADEKGIGIEKRTDGNGVGQIKNAGNEKDNGCPESRERVRVFFPKGNLARSHCIADTLPALEEKYCRAVVGLCENSLIENYRKKDFLGNVYLSQEFRHYLVPFSQRSASKALKTIVRGSRLPIASEVNALRAFIWWTNTEASDEAGRVDLDLSACVFDGDWNFLEHVSYTNLRSLEYRMCHSGDIVNGGPVDGPGVSEFLDVDIASVLQHGGRYVVYQVYSFIMQKFSELPHAMFGWMGREDVGSGEIYEPATVEQKMDLASQGVVCIPVIFDCQEREMIWCDMNLSLNGCRTSQGGNNLESNLRGVAAACYGIVHMQRPNLYDLIALHIRARGVQVDNKEEADMIFDVEEGITPFDTDVFMGEYI